MTNRDSTPAGAPCWADLMCSDFEASKKFYTALFGWEYEQTDPEQYGGYTNAHLNGRLVAGLSPYDPAMGGIPDVWGVYLKSDDIQATTAAVEAAGGQVLAPPMHVEPYGHMAIYLDAGQAAVGAWQPETHQGFGVEVEPGSPAWHELYAKDYAGSVDFYQKAFGWKTSVMADSDDFRYTTLGEGDAALAGIMDGSGFLPAEVPAHWMNYWLVDDVDAACKVAVANGGTVVEEPADSPFGRLATLADCCGARFRITAQVTES